MRDINVELKEIVEGSRVVLFIKGTPLSPACGFSARAVAILKANSIEPSTYHFINVLEDNEIREGIKAFSQWPTIPQLYINGEFIGGSDIMTELHESGELKHLLFS